MRDYHYLEKVTSADEIVTPKKTTELVRVPADHPIRGIVACDGLFALKTHWDGKRNRRVLCQGEGPCEIHETCRLLTSHLIAVWDLREDKPVWIELTPHAGRNLLQQIQRLEMALFGATVLIGRVRKHEKAPICVTVDTTAAPKTIMKKAMTPEETIARVFESSDRPCATRKKRVQ